MHIKYFHEIAVMHDRHKLRFFLSAKRLNIFFWPLSHVNSTFVLLIPVITNVFSRETKGYFSFK